MPTALSSSRWATNHNGSAGGRPLPHRTLRTGEAEVLRDTEVQHNLGNAQVLDSGTFLGHGSYSSLCAQQAVSMPTAATSSSATPGLLAEQAAEGEERGPCGHQGQGKNREGAAEVPTGHREPGALKDWVGTPQPLLPQNDLS